LEPRLAMIDWLRGERPRGNTLGTDALDEAQLGAAIRARGNLSFESDWMTLRVMQRFFAGEHREAARLAREGEPLLPYSAAFVSRPEYEFYHALSLAALAREAAAAERARFVARIAE